MISGTRMAAATRVQTHGYRVTRPAHRFHRPARSGLLLGRRNAGSLPPNRCRPSSDMTAGSSDRAASTAVSTATAVTRPRVVTSGISATASDTSAMITVVPANTIALPAVATDSAIASR